MPQALAAGLSPWSGWSLWKIAKAFWDLDATHRFYSTHMYSCNFTLSNDKNILIAIHENFLPYSIISAIFCGLEIDDRKIVNYKLGRGSERRGFPEKILCYFSTYLYAKKGVSEMIGRQSVSSGMTLFINPPLSSLTVFQIRKLSISCFLCFSCELTHTCFCITL